MARTPTPLTIHAGAFSRHRPSIGDVSAALREVQRRFPFPDYIRPPFDAYFNIAMTVARYLRPGERILDFGAGPCDKLAVLSQLGYKCTAYDDLCDPWHNGKQAEILHFSAESGIEYCLPGATPPWQHREFDLVMLNDVLEHLHDSPRELLTELLGAVRAHGYLVITVPNAVNIRKRLAVLVGRTNLPPFDQYWWSSSPWRGHVREYTRGDLLLLAQYLGLSPVQLEGCHHMLAKVPRRLRRVYRLATSTFDGWRDTWMFVAQKSAGWRPTTLAERAQ